jgi:cysteine desulfurase
MNNSDGNGQRESVKLPIYLDNHATTPVDPRVLAAMLPCFREKFGNASSRNHSFGWQAEAAVEQARAQVAKLLGASAKEIVFTSGATESDNLAIKGVAEACRGKGNNIVTVVTEHKAVLDSCKHLEKQGYRATYLPVQSDGRLRLEELERALTGETILVSVMAANNEVGVLQPLEQIGALCRRRGVLFHTDAAQAAGKIPLDVEKMSIDLLSLSGHKMYGPKGVGALYVRRNPPAPITAMIDGGGQEHGVRSGTLNVPGIVGLGQACEIAREELAAESARIAALRDRLRNTICDRVAEVVIHGSMEHRLPGNLNLSFTGVDGESLLVAIGDDIAVSSGAACTSAKLEPSYVLKALGASDDLANSSLRFGIGRFNSEAEIDHAAARVVEAVHRLRELTVGA